MDKINTLSILEESLQHFMDEYTIKDGVFGLFRDKLYELTCGYLIPESEHDTLESAIRNMKPSQVIRIEENKKFTIGDVASSLGDCPHGCKVLDIEFLEEINRY